MGMDSTGRSRLLGIGFALAMATLVLPGGVVGATRVSDKLPDLRMASLQRFHLQTLSNGHRLIRFDTTIVNVGVGAFEALGNRSCSTSSCPLMSVRQVIYRTDGSKRYVARDGHMKYAGDGHNHWHVQRIEKYEIFRRDTVSSPRRGAKVGFCFFDNVAYRLSLPGAPNHRVYAESGCGTVSSLSTRVGLSVGWGDLYPYDFVYQWIDITGLAPGPYRVCVTTDPQDRYLETDNTNNMVWQNVDLASGGGISIGTKGWSPCHNGIPTARDAGQAGADEELPDATPISGDEPGSVMCAIPSSGAVIGAQGRGGVACRTVGASSGSVSLVKTAGVTDPSVPAGELAAGLAPPRRASLVARATGFGCLV